MADNWWESWVPAVVPYAVLLRLLGDGQISAEEFEVVFLPLYKNDSTAWPREIFDVLDGFFADVDDFCADPEVRVAVGGIDEQELRGRAAAALAQLEAVVGGHAPGPGALGG